ncbi:peptidoglycan-binding domain 1 protein [Microbacterium sp. HM58-2]|nr:peptidoglycan-binding domain 1 protein [Microbacterium sp. HM58-2]
MKEDATPTTELPADLLEDAEDAEAAADGAADADMSRVRGWRRILRGNRTLWIVALCAIVSLIAGLLVGRFLIAPAAASEAPEPGLVTVPVEFGALSNDVTLRADVGYADAVEVTIDTTGGGSIVTGAVPEVGATLSPLSIALEVEGRPVIVLPGELPAYRTLRMGVSGPDVLQLKQALVSVGIDAGDVSSNLFDQATANAVGALYAQAGYPLPTPEEGADEAVRGAEESLRLAQSGVTQAQQALAAAGAGPSKLESWQADVKVAQAEQALAAAKACVPGDAEAEPCPNVQQAEWDLKTARLERDQLWSAKNTGPEKAALDAARAQVDAANEALADARQSVQPYLPAGEVLFLTELPRRVDAVNVKRGSSIQGAVMTVSGATVRLTGAAAEADARLLEAGDEATFELPDGTEHRAVIAELKPGKDSKARWEVLFEPDPLTPEQITQLQGSNVRVRIAVGATDGDVLSVPLAALTAGPGGESRVEVVDSDPREGEDAETRMVVVETGLAAEGAVEVTPVDGELEEGDLVVVGR